MLKLVNIKVTSVFARKIVRFLATSDFAALDLQIVLGYFNSQSEAWGYMVTMTQSLPKSFDQSASGCADS